MEGTRKWKKTNFLAILWAVAAIMLSAVPCVWAEELNIDYPVSGSLTVDGIANLLPGAAIEWWVYATETSTVNITGGTVVYWIDVAPGANVTVYGTGFNLDEGEHFIDYGTVTGFYENGYPINLTFDCQPDATVTLAAPGGSSPEQLIEQLIQDVEDLNLKEGIDNSLDAKLQNALDALEAANAGQRQDAVNKMNAFISAVEAQSGKAIEEADANDLIYKANVIISLL